MIKQYYYSGKLLYTHLCKVDNHRQKASTIQTSRHRCIVECWSLQYNKIKVIFFQFDFSSVRLTDRKLCAGFLFANEISCPDRGRRSKLDRFSLPVFVCYRCSCLFLLTELELILLRQLCRILFLSALRRKKLTNTCRGQFYSL